MIKILIDTAVIVALITVFGVIFSSLIAPLVLQYFKPKEKESAK